MRRMKAGLWSFRWWRLGLTFHTDKYLAVVASWRPKPWPFVWDGGIVGLNVLGLIMDREPLWAGYAVLGPHGFRLCLREEPGSKHRVVKYVPAVSA